MELKAYLLARMSRAAYSQLESLIATAEQQTATPWLIDAIWTAEGDELASRRMSGALDEIQTVEIAYYDVNLLGRDQINRSSPLRCRILDVVRFNNGHLRYRFSDAFWSLLKDMRDISSMH